MKSLESILKVMVVLIVVALVATAIPLGMVKLKPAAYIFGRKGKDKLRCYYLACLL